MWKHPPQVYNNLAQEKQDTTLQAEALTAIQKYFQLESRPLMHTRVRIHWYLKMYLFN